MKLCTMSLISVLIISSPLLANDGFGALGVGGIIVGKTDKIAMAKEVLNVSPKLISVNYDFVNESGTDVTSLIVFPLPPYPASPNEGGIIAAGQPSGFEIKVNGQPVTFETKVRATFDGKDITAQLKSMGLSDKQIASLPFDKSLEDDHQLVIPDPQRKKLNAAGFLRDGSEPLWDIYVTYEWMQTFPAKSTLHVMHSYHPFVAEGTTSGYTPAETIPAHFCLSQKQKNKLNTLFKDKKNLDGYGEIPGTEIDYVLMTANTWKDGIRDFKLRIHSEADSEVVASCYPKGLHQVGPRDYEVAIKNFKPENDLQIYIGNEPYKYHKANQDLYGIVPQFKK